MKSAGVDNFITAGKSVANITRVYFCSFRVESVDVVQPDGSTISYPVSVRILEISVLDSSMLFEIVGICSLDK